MAELDPSLILQAYNTNDPTRMMNMQQLAASIKAKQQEAQDQNAIRTMMHQPGAINPNTGLATPNLVGQLSRTGSPEAMDRALQYGNANAADDLKRQQTEDRHMAEMAKMQTDQTLAAMAVRQDAKDRGLSDERADALMQESWAKNWEDLRTSKGLADADMPHMSRPSFRDLQSKAMQDPGYRAERVDAERQRVDDDRIRHEGVMERNADRRLAASAGGAIPDDDPSIKAAARYGIDPRVLLGRGNAAQRRATVDAILKENPKFDERLYGSSSKALTDFFSGGQQSPGNRVTNANTAIAHLDTYQEMVRAFGSHDVNVLNRAKKLWETEFGSPAPNNLGLAAQFVANEVGKAVMPSSTGEERDHFEQFLSAIKSQPQQLGAAQTMQQFLVGQVSSLEQAYSGKTFRDDFRERFLSPRTRQIYDAMPNPMSAKADKNMPRPKTPEDAMKLKPGTQFVDPSGVVRTR